MGSRIESWKNYGIDSNEFYTIINRERLIHYNIVFFNGSRNEGCENVPHSIHRSKNSNENGITSPDLFSIVFGSILKELGVCLLPSIYSKNFEGGGAIAYADDLVLLSKNSTLLQEILNKFVILAANFGLEVNVQKTVVILFLNFLFKMKNCSKFLFFLIWVGS